MPLAVRNLAADCGLTLGPSRGRVVVDCPRCPAQAYALRGSGVRVGLPTLRQGTLDSGGGVDGNLRHGSPHRYRGRPMVLRRHRLMVALYRWGVRPRGYDDLVLLALGAPLLQFSPHGPTRTRGLPASMEPAQRRIPR
jgi:hypothetical protein